MNLKEDYTRAVDMVKKGGFKFEFFEYIINAIEKMVNDFIASPSEMDDIREELLGMMIEENDIESDVDTFKDLAKKKKSEKKLSYQVKC